MSSTSKTGTVTFNSDTSAGDVVVVEFTNSIRNPTVGEQSSSIEFYSTVTESGTTYDIDLESTSITVTPNTYGTLTSATAERVDSSQINEITDLDIKATSANPILVDSTITFCYPLDQVVLNVGSIDDLTFFELDSSGNAGSQLTPTSRSENSTYYTIEFIEW